jgi:Chaperone of endosialidase/Carbohydrate esterase, sialic acid-specific acetylesterase
MPRKLLIVFNGESNSIGQASNASATPSELLPLAAVRILDNTTLQFVTLQLGADGRSLHGWELGLAIEAAKIPDLEVYLVKTGLGGTKITDWDVSGGLYQTAITRVNAAKSLIGSGYASAIWYSQGINDVLTGPENIWIDRTVAHLNTFRAAVDPNALILYTELPQVYATKNASVKSLPSLVPNSNYILTGDATLGDVNHWDYKGMKLIASRLLSSTYNHFFTIMPDQIIQVIQGAQSTLSGVAGDITTLVDARIAATAPAIVDARITATAPAIADARITANTPAIADARISAAVPWRATPTANSIDLALSANSLWMSNALNVFPLTASSTAFGVDAGKNNTSTFFTAFGDRAGSGNTATNVAAFGALAGFNNSGTQLTALGGNAASANTGIQVTAAGVNSALNNTFANVSCFGYQAVCLGANQVQLGNAATTVYSFATATRSDRRDKADITPLDTAKCVAFFNGLNPIKHKWDRRDSYRWEQSAVDENGEVTELIAFADIKTDGTHKGTRFHASYIAQEVQELLESTGLADDCSIIKNAAFDGGEDVLSLDKEQLFVIQTVVLQDALKRIAKLELALAAK